MLSPEAMRHLVVAGLAGIAGLVLSLLLTPVVRWLAVRNGIIAKPAGDRWGKRTIARLGGVAMFLSFLATTLVFVPLTRSLSGVFAGLALVFVLGLYDDFRRMTPYAKLVAQLLIGCLVVLGGVRIELIEPTWLAIPLSVLWFVLVMNAFNLLDNMDGLAAGIGAIAAAFCGIHAALAGQWVLVSLNAILCGTCAGFLRSNFPPAKIYMGDSGSHFLGLSLAVFSIMGTWRHSTQLLSILVVPALVLAVPIFDTCFVMVQRIMHGQHPFIGGTDHVSHRLAILGLSIRRTNVLLYAISVGLGLLSLLSARIRFMPTLALAVPALAALVLFGRYLSQVKVYRLVEPPAMPAGSEPSVTLINTMLLHKRRLVEILVDFCVLGSAYVLAHLLRFEGTLTPELQRLIMQSLPIILVVKLACFAGCGVYRGVWRYLGLSDLLVLLKAVTLGSLVSACALLYLWRFADYSRAVLIIDWMLTFLAVGGSRVAERLLDDWVRASAKQGIPVLVIGAGDTGAHVLHSLAFDRGSGRQVIGLLDDDMRKLGSRIRGCLVIGSRAALAEALATYGVREVFIAINDPPGELLQYVREQCEPRGVAWKVVTAGVTDVP